jgi:ABC-2 type transport system ATP-binding protein
VAGFVGPNGAGKSTTIRMLLGLITPTSGEGEVLGHPIDRPAAYLHRVGALIEAPAFYPTLTGEANLQVFARLGGHDRGRIAEVLEVVGLSERGGDRYKNYALGMKQRLGIALALLPDPDLLILDEPTNGLDPQGIVEIRSLLMQLGARGKTVFVSSHLLAEIQAACDSIVMIDRGGVVFSGSMADLLARNSPTIRAAADNATDTARLIELVAAVAWLLDYLFLERKEHRVTADCDVRNDKAAALLDRLQMRREAHHLQSAWWKDEWVDECVYAVLAHEWLERRSPG